MVKVSGYQKSQSNLVKILEGFGMENQGILHVWSIAIFTAIG
jgi:hypothetical protein